MKIEDPRLRKIAERIGTACDFSLDRIQEDIQEAAEAAAFRVLTNLDEPLAFEDRPSDVVRGMGPTHPFLTCICELCCFRRAVVERLEEVERDAVMFGDFG